MVRRALFGLQRSGDRGVCAQTGHVSGRDFWPANHQYISIERDDWNMHQLTRFTDCLFTTGQTKRVDSESVTNGASQLERDLVS